MTNEEAIKDYLNEEPKNIEDRINWLERMVMALIPESLIDEWAKEKSDKYEESLKKLEKIFKPTQPSREEVK